MHWNAFGRLLPGLFRDVVVDWHVIMMISID